MKINALHLACLLALPACSLPALAADCSLAAPLSTAQADDTDLLQHGIDACAAQGGGTLRLAARTYNIGPIQLKSHVYLALAPDTIIKGTTDKQRYVPAFIGWPYREHEALISGYQISDAGIIGTGQIDGQGEVWWAEARTQRKDGTMTRLYPALPDANGMPRPWLVEFYDAHDILIDGPRLQNAPMWNLALRYSKKVSIKNLTILNPKEAANTDGIDIVSSQQISIDNADISTGDDNITIKSGLASFNMPAQAASLISIHNVKLGDGHGISVGSETLNGVDHVSVDGAQFNGTTNGIRIKTGRDRGAEIAYLTLRNITMHQVGMALSVTAYYPNVPDDRGAPQAITASTPHIHDVQIENLQADGIKSAGRFIGLPEAPLTDFSLSNVHIDADQGLTLRDASLKVSKLRIKTAKGSAITRQEAAVLIQN
jgi:polygalacturonase